MSSYNQIYCLGYTIFTDDLNKLRTDGKILVSTINQYSYCIAERDAEFKQFLRGSDVVLPDGIGMVAAVKLFNNKKIKKIAGADLHQFLLEKLNMEKGSCFYLGASEETLDKITTRINREFPNIRVKGYAPPYKTRFSDSDNQKMIEEVNSFRPNVLFVGMTAPKQEKWAGSNKNVLNANLICSIGAVFDFYAGTVKRPNKLWISLGLEWLGRLVKEPRRMWKRYIYYGVVFGFYLLKEKINRFFKLGRYKLVS